MKSIKRKHRHFPTVFNPVVVIRAITMLARLTSRLPLSGKDSHTLAFLIIWPRASYSTLVIALFPGGGSPCSN
jgi:hypothetical protein